MKNSVKVVFGIIISFAFINILVLLTRNSNKQALTNKENEKKRIRSDDSKITDRKVQEKPKLKEKTKILPKNVEKQKQIKEDSPKNVEKKKKIPQFKEEKPHSRPIISEADAARLQKMAELLKKRQKEFEESLAKRTNPENDQETTKSEEKKEEEQEIDKKKPENEQKKQEIEKKKPENNEKNEEKPKIEEKKPEKTQEEQKNESPTSNPTKTHKNFPKPNLPKRESSTISNFPVKPEDILRESYQFAKSTSDPVDGLDADEATEWQTYHATMHQLYKSAYTQLQENYENHKSPLKIISKQPYLAILLNYADIRFFERQINNAQTGKAIGKFDIALSFGRKHLDPDFQQKHSKILNLPRGAGYWLWKPRVILEVMNMFKENPNIIIGYADSGTNFVGDGTKLLKRLASEKNNHVFVFSNWFKETTFTKRDAFVLMDADEKYFYEPPQADAQFIAFKNTPQAREFVEEWLGYCTDERILTDIPSSQGKPDFNDFRDHRHDQSILSLVVKKRMKRGNMIFDPIGRGDLLVRG